MQRYYRNPAFPQQWVSNWKGYAYPPVYAPRSSLGAVDIPNWAWIGLTVAAVWYLFPPGGR